MYLFYPRYRAVVEHVFAYIKRYEILAGVYRGKISQSTTHIYNATKIIVHISALHCTLSPLRTLYPLVINRSLRDLDVIRDELFVDSGWEFGDFNRGDYVEAYSGGRWLRGTIIRVSNTTQTYTIRWPDRTTVSGYEARYLRRSDRFPPPIWRPF
jgi:hypothetical protein